MTNVLRRRYTRIIQCQEVDNCNNITIPHPRQGGLEGGRWWVAQRSVCSSPALLAAPLSNGSSRCWGSWIAVFDVAWIHVSAWMQASLQCKANESVGKLRWTTWWLPLLVPGSRFETCFCKVIIVEALLPTTLFHSVRPTSWKHWPIRLNSGGPSSVRARKYSGSNHA